MKFYGRPMHRHVSPVRFANGNLKRGETFSVDSGMGGSWTVKFVRFEEGGPVFLRTPSVDWPKAIYAFDSPEHAARELYVLVSEGGA